MLRKILFISSDSALPKAGFTLIELMVVIMIIALMTASALPSLMSSSRKGNFQSMVSGVVTLIEQARTQALASELDAVKKSPPGGYGVFLDMVNQEAILFVDDYNAAAVKPVNMDYADKDIDVRISPDGVYTSATSSAPANGDTILKTVEMDSRSYMRLAKLSGKSLSDTDWSQLSGKLTLIFTPPYAEASVTTTDESGNVVSLKSFEAKFDLLTEKIFRKIVFNRVTTTPQVIQGNN